MIASFLAEQHNDKQNEPTKCRRIRLASSPILSTDVLSPKIAD